MKILKQLAEINGLSGAEGEVRAAILKLIEKQVDEIQVDSLGSIIATKRGTGESTLRVMVDAHMDEVGLMVNGYNGDGTLKVAAIGGLDDRILIGMRVVVGPNKLPGVIGGTPVHLAPGSGVVALKDLRVDIGAASKEAAQGKAPLGTRVAFHSEFLELGQVYRSKALDDRAGCAVLVELLSGDRTPFDLIGTFTTQEEVGVRGAKVAAQRIQPDLAFILETTTCDDLPKDSDTTPVTEMHKGPAISLMDSGTIYDRRLIKLLEDAATREGIPYQYKRSQMGGNNAASIHLAGPGVPVAGISIPLRYMHSFHSMISKADYKHMIQLMQAALKLLGEQGGLG